MVDPDAFCQDLQLKTSASHPLHCKHIFDDICSAVDKDIKDAIRAMQTRYREEYLTFCQEHKGPA